MSLFHIPPAHVARPEMAAALCHRITSCSRSHETSSTTYEAVRHLSHANSFLSMPPATLKFRLTSSPRRSSELTNRKVNAVVADRTQDRETGAVFEESDAIEEVVIVGGGVAGLATALALHRVGISSLVLERSSGPREGGAALSMWGNAWRALEVLGVAERLREGYSPLERSVTRYNDVVVSHRWFGRVELCSRKGELLKSFTIAECVQGPHEVRGVHRGSLLAALAAPLPPRTIRYDSRPVTIREGSRKGTTDVELEDGSVITTKVLLGCDGTRSSVATYLGLPPPTYAGYAACRGVAEYPLGTNGKEGGGHELGNTIRMVWGEGVRAGMYPLTDTKVYWFTCFNAPQDGFSKLRGSAAAIKDFALSTVEGWGYGVEDVIGRTDPENISVSDISDRWTLPLPGVRWGKGGVTVLGDAAHPMTPNLGQGACTSLEDAVVLARELAGACSIVDPSVTEGVGRRAEFVGRGAQRLRRVVGSEEAVEEALKRVDVERIRRTGKLSVRSNLMGVALQIPYAPVCFIRDMAVPFIVNTSHFLDHALYDCGELPVL